MKLIFILAGLALFTHGTASAATRTVTSLADSGPNTLRAHLATAAAGDVINFGVTGTITLTSAGLEVDRNLTITGPGADQLTIRCETASIPSVVDASHSNPITLTMSGLTIHSTTSRAIKCWGNLTLSNAVITGRTAEKGGGLYMQGTMRLENCTFLNCRAFEGAALFLHGGENHFILNCTFDRNVTTFSQTGIVAIEEAFDSEMLTTIRYSTFSRNQGGRVITNKGDAAWGSLEAGRSTLVLENCTIADNGGPALENIPSGIARTVLRSCTLTNNSNNDFGQSNAATIQSRTGQSVTLENTILKRGSAGANLWIPSGEFISRGYNLCDDDGAGLLTGPGDRINTDPGLDPFGLLYHGGYTETIALVHGSPALDQGKSFGLVYDQRSYVRPVDNPLIASAAGGDGSDIGAFEAPPVARQAGFPSFIVTTLDDHDDGYASAADCTLREAVRITNELPGPNTITFAPGLTGTATLQGAIAELVVSDHLTITGPGARTLAVSGGGGASRLFRILDVFVEIRGLTLRNGIVGPGSVNGETMQGGAIHNSGDLRCYDCTFSDNIVRGTDRSGLFGQAGGAGQGGAIYNGKTLWLEGCTFTRNQAYGGHGSAGERVGGVGGAGGGASGGAIFNDALGTLTLTNCTLQGNTAQGGAGGIAESGGTGGAATAAIYCVNPGGLTNCTVSGNVATGGAGGPAFDIGGRPGPVGFGIGGISATNGVVLLRYTLCAANSVTTGLGRGSPDARGTFTGTYNLIGAADDSTGLTGGPGNQTGTEAAPLDPKLGALQNNGGPTDTMSLLTGSPAIDAAVKFPTHDQIGTVRPLDAPAIPNVPGGDGTDIGAVEVDAPQPGPHFVVTTLADQNDGVASSLSCSLREAINASNAQAGPNTISFKPGLSGSILLSNGMMTITGSVAITGPGARVVEVVGQSSADRILDVTGGTNSISGLTFRNGRETGASQSGTQYGGAMQNAATLTLTDCSFVSNVVTGANGAGAGARNGGPGAGGAVANRSLASLHLVRCTFAGNSAGGGGGTGGGSTGGSGGPAWGGAVFSDVQAVLTVENCTFHNNSAAGGNGAGTSSGGEASGGAIHSLGSLSVASATIHGNSASVGRGGNAVDRGGGLFSGSPGANVRNTICAGNTTSDTSPDIDGAFASGGWNLIGTISGSTGFPGTGDQTGTNAARLDPLLGPLANNGGYTDTKQSLPGSPARDRGRALGLTLDQRSYARTADSLALPNAPGGDGTDIGAVEYHPLTGTDTDGDHMPDDFESFYGFNPASAADGPLDADSDGASNAAEYIAGTSPRDPGSKLRITSITRDDTGRFAIAFAPVITGRTYQLQRSPDLRPPWTGIIAVAAPLPQPGSAVFNGIQRYTYSTPPDFIYQTIPKDFYRVQASLSP